MSYPFVPWQRRALASIAAAALLPVVASAQTTSSAPAPAATATATPARATPGSEDIVQLTPFEVASDKTKGYAALESNSITQFKTDLGRLPVSADIFDSQFISDVGATSVEALIDTYSAGAGIATANPGSSASGVQALDRNGNSFLSLRGVTAPTMLRDGLLPLNTFFNSGGTSTNYTSSFDVENVAVVNGPQALLYGVGGAGGVVNLVSKQAHLGQPAFGSFQFQTDQYGDKLGLLDYGVGSDKVAVRVALTDQDIGGRRVDIGGPLQGEYVQVAFRVPLGQYTDIRLIGEQTNYDKQNSAGGVSVTALNTANDARNGQNLRYLLYTNQLGAAANGAASGGGPIPGVNWNNVDSFASEWDGEFTLDTFETGTIDTKWNSWLSTEVMGGYRTDIDKVSGSSPGLAAPNVAANPTGVWALDTGSPGMLYEPLREKVGRISALATNDFLGGSAHSQTVLGVDYTRADGDVITYNYEQADGNFNPVIGTSTSNNGYTVMPTVYWPLQANPIRQPYFAPLQQHVTVNGTNYVLMIPNDTVASLVGPGNPLGLSGHGSGDHRIGKDINSGIYLANDTDWMNNRFSTLVGVRVGRTDELNQLETGFTTSGDLAAKSNTVGFNAGVNYALLSWLRPYVTASSSFDAPAVLSASPTGAAPEVAHAVGEEAGLKIVDPNEAVSGSIAFFHTVSDNEQYSFTSTLTNDINPAGLNGRYGAVSNFVALNRTTKGMNATITASPNANWTMRLSAAFVQGKILSNVNYPQYYNDQFYENSSGQVTYQDGSLVYVSTTATKATAATSTTAGAVPLTVAMMNTSSSLYYANPAAVTGAISSTSGAGVILLGTGNTQIAAHGPILTGATGLPISAIQIAPLASSPPPGSIQLALPGDYTTQFPRWSANYTATYTFTTGKLQGLKLGGTVSAYWQYADYYYYPNGLSQPDAPRVLFYQPDDLMFSAILGWQHKFGRFTFSTQLNVFNMFNTYHVFLLPNAVTGYTTGPDSVTFDQQPRQYLWSSTIHF